MIVINEVKKKISDIEINVTLEIDDSSIFGIIGESGSGKTTLLKILDGIINYDSGNIIFPDKKQISMIFQDFNLLENLTIFNNVALALKLLKKYDEDKVNEVLKFVGLEDKKNYYPSQISGGQKQRVAIARAIVTNPNILLCDEPSASLDKKTTKDIVDLFLRINKKYNTTIILVTHELEIAKAMCDRVAVMEKGRIIDLFNVNKDINFLNNKKNYLDYAKEVLLNG